MMEEILMERKRYKYLIDQGLSLEEIRLKAAKSIKKESTPDKRLKTV